MKQSINEFLTTPLGSFIKVFVYAMLAFLVESILNKTFVFPPDSQFLWAMFYSGLAAAANTIHNWLNPHYEQFGKRKKPADLPAEPIPNKKQN